MNITRKSIAVIGIALILAALAWGTYFPYRKSRAINAVNRNLGGVTTLDRFLGVFDKALVPRSPYGQEEAVLFINEQLQRALGAQGDPRVVSTMVAYAEKMFAPLLGDGSTTLTTGGSTALTAGGSPAKNLLSLSRIHHLAWTRTGDATYARRSEELYLRCLEASSRRPECLYGLFGLYASGNKKEQARKIGGEILNYWPSDERVREIVNSF
ncbi:MAG: hypothetical protein Q8Q41_00820 [bacterium]|nr:hypothetical protein [bacterium]